MPHGAEHGVLATTSRLPIWNKTEISIFTISQKYGKILQVLIGDKENEETNFFIDISRRSDYGL